MGGQVTQPQPLPIPVPPFGQPSPNQGPQAPSGPSAGMKGGSLAGIPDLQTLFNAGPPELFPNTLSFPRQGPGVTTAPPISMPGGPFLGTPGDPVLGAPVIPAQPAAPATPAAPMSAFMQMLQRIAPRAVPGSALELEHGPGSSVHVD